MHPAPEIEHSVPVFQAQDSRGQLITPDHFIGHPSVIYFYPKNDTPGCTKQACDLRDHKAELQQLNTLVIGVSPDSADSHHKFMKKYALDFIYIPDPFHELCTLFGVWEEQKIFGKTKWGVTRTTFVIDAKGIIRWIEKPVDVQGHAERVLQAVQSLPKVSDPL